MDSLDLLLSKPSGPSVVPRSSLSKYSSQSGSTQQSSTTTIPSYRPSVDSLDALASSSSISGKPPVQNRRQASNPSALLSTFSSSSSFSSSLSSDSRPSVTSASSSSSSYIPSAIENSDSSNVSRRWGSLQSRQRALDQLSQQPPPPQFAPENPTQYKVLNASESSTSTDGFDPGDKQRQAQLIECPDCHRSFKRPAFLVHQRVCKKVFTQKPKHDEKEAAQKNESSTEDEQQQKEKQREQQKEKWKEESAKLREEMKKAKKIKRRKSCQFWY